MAESTFEKTSSAKVSGWEKWDKAKLFATHESEFIEKLSSEAVGMLPLDHSRLFVLLRSGESFIVSERSVRSLGRISDNDSLSDFEKPIDLYRGSALVLHKDVMYTNGKCNSLVCFYGCSVSSLTYWQKEDFIEFSIDSKDSPMGVSANSDRICWIYEGDKDTMCVLVKFKPIRKEFRSNLGTKLISSATDFVSVAMTSSNVVISVGTQNKPGCGLFVVKMDELLQGVQIDEMLYKIGQASISTITTFPFTMSPLLAIEDRVYSFGGMDCTKQPVSDVLNYNFETDSWTEVGYMRTSRFKMTVAYEVKSRMVFVAFGFFSAGTHPAKSLTIEKCSLSVE